MSIAAVNAPDSLVLSGTSAAVKAVMLKLNNPSSKQLVVSHSFHSPLMAGMMPEFDRFLASMESKHGFQPCKIPLVSNLDGRVKVGEVLGPAHWSAHVMQPVRLMDGMRELVSRGVNVFIEAGPQPTLTHMGRQYVATLGANRPHALWVHSLHPMDVECLQRAHHKLAVFGVELKTPETLQPITATQEPLTIHTHAPQWSVERLEEEVSKFITELLGESCEGRLYEFGFDSLKAVELHSQLEALLKCAIPKDSIFGPTATVPSIASQLFIILEQQEKVARNASGANEAKSGGDASFTNRDSSNRGLVDFAQFSTPPNNGSVASNESNVGNNNVSNSASRGSFGTSSSQSGDDVSAHLKLLTDAVQALALQQNIFQQQLRGLSLISPSPYPLMSQQQQFQPLFYSNFPFQSSIPPFPYSLPTALPSPLPTPFPSFPHQSFAPTPPVSFPPSLPSLPPALPSLAAPSQSPIPRPPSSTPDQSRYQLSLAPEGRGHILLVQPRVAGKSDMEGILSFLRGHVSYFKEQLVERGALLLRNVGAREAADFAELCNVFGQSRDYKDGISPRTEVGGGVYTSTEYPPHLDMALHNEMSYNPFPPRRIAFFCHSAPVPGTGQTPLGCSAEILRAMDSELVKRFTKHGLKYIVNSPTRGGGPGVPWQTMYRTDHKAEVERLCTELNVSYRWNADGGLTTLRSATATRVHPDTKEELWFNHSHLFHPSDLPESTYQVLKKACRNPTEFPKYCLFGDGSEIPEEDLSKVRKVLNSSQILFDWQEGDVLILDNYTMCHGRRHFDPTTKRRILAFLIY